MARVYIDPSHFSFVTRHTPIPDDDLMELLKNYGTYTAMSEFISGWEEDMGKPLPSDKFVWIGKSRPHAKKWFTYIEFENPDDALLFKLSWTEK